MHLLSQRLQRWKKSENGSDGCLMQGLTGPPRKGKQERRKRKGPNWRKEVATRDYHLQYSVSYYATPPATNTTITDRVCVSETK